MTAEKNTTREPRTAGTGRDRSGWAVILTRWIMLIAIAYAIVLSAPVPAPLWPHQVFIFAILLSNLVLTWLLRHGRTWGNVSAWTTGLDIVTVTMAIAVAGAAPTEFYLVYFSVLILAAVVDRMALLVPLALIACASYGILLIADQGDAAWRDAALLVRIPVIFGVALYFGTAVQTARREHAREMQRLNLERGRALRALAEMGRMAFSDQSASPVLYELAGWVQEIVDVDRCSLLVFEENGRLGYLAASGDDPSVDVVTLEMGEYPEIEPVLARGEVTELHPGRPPELWEKVQANLPDNSPFRSFLVIPIKRDGDVLGAFYLRDADPERAFTEEHVEFCSQAGHMVSALIFEQDLLSELKEARAELEKARAADAGEPPDSA